MISNPFKDDEEDVGPWYRTVVIEVLTLCVSNFITARCEDIFYYYIDRHFPEESIDKPKDVSKIGE